MADAEPVGKQLHRSLHALGNQKIPDGFRHPPATESGGSTRKGLQFWGARGDAWCATNLKRCIKILFWV